MQISISKDGVFFHDQDLETLMVNRSNIFLKSDSKNLFYSEGDLIVSASNKITIWKRAYRTKGLRSKCYPSAIRAVSNNQELM